MKQWTVGIYTGLITMFLSMMFHAAIDSFWMAFFIILVVDAPIIYGSYQLGLRLDNESET